MEILSTAQQSRLDITATNTFENIATAIETAVMQA